jgi:hypothetical protein
LSTYYVPVIGNTPVTLKRYDFCPHWGYSSGEEMDKFTLKQTGKIVLNKDMQEKSFCEKIAKKDLI